MRGKQGFTLPELLTVIAIIALLMMASFGGLTRARELAKRTKSEAQLRLLVSAWQQYFVTYSAWPGDLDGKVDVPMTYPNLEPLVNPDHNDNEKGIVFLTYAGAGPFNDSWGTPYQISFGKSETGGNNDRNLTAFETSVALPRRKIIQP